MVVKKQLTWHTEEDGSQTLQEGVQADLVDEKGILTVKGQTALIGAVNSPIWHRSVDLGIKEFKRYLKRIPMMTKSKYSQAVKLYKQKAWIDFEETINYKGSFPTVRI